MENLFDGNHIVKNFLNKNSIAIIKALNQNKKLFSRDLLSNLKKKDILIKKSQFYRYLNTLNEINIIEIGKWEKNSTQTGYSYSLSPFGKKFIRKIESL